MAAMVALVVLTAGAIGILTYRSIESVALPRALSGMEFHARMLALELEASVRGARADIVAFQSAAALDGIVAATLAGGVHPRDGTTVAEWRDRLARRFSAELAAKPHYTQFRVVGVADGGREILRVDRSAPDGTIRVVPQAELQRKGDRDYFLRAVRMSAGDVDVSPIELNRENGVVEVPHLPVFRAAAAIHVPDGQVFGIIIINVELQSAFSGIRAAAKQLDRRIFVTNARGDYLLHPDAEKEFAFQFGRTAGIQDDFPTLSAALATDKHGALVARDRAGARFGAAVASVRLAGGPRVSVIELVPYSQLLAATTAARNSTLLAGLIAILVAVLLAAVTTRSLTRPLAGMIQAVQAFGDGKAMSTPTDATGEIGVLAKAFERMAADVQEKNAALSRETEHRRRVFETSLDLILIVDRRGRILEASPSSLAILGYAPGEMIGRSAREFLYTADLDSTRREMRLARRGQDMRNFQTRYVHREGQVVTLAWTGVWSEPEQRHFFIGRDMTERKLEEEKFRLAVEASPSGMLMTDSAGRIVMVNTEIERLFGYRRDELVGRPVDLLVPKHVRAQHAHHRAFYAGHPENRRMAAGRALFGERKDGTEFPMEIALTFIQTREGPLTLSVVVDVTERKRAERLKDEFVATVSHELRTPLTSIAGSLGLLAGGAAGELSDSAARLLTIAYSNSRRLVRLINDILDIEKLELGRVEFHLRRVDVKTLAAQAIEANGAFSDSFRVRMRLDVCEEEAAVRADPDRLTQVLINLLSNAAKFSPPDQEVIVSVTARGNRVRIAVRDHGPGIPHNFRDRIFEKFAQSDATARRQGGTGLGLSIARQIVNQLGGAIGYESAPGGGTIFFADLPRWDPQTMHDAPAERQDLKKSA